MTTTVKSVTFGDMNDVQIVPLRRGRPVHEKAQPPPTPGAPRSAASTWLTSVAEPDPSREDPPDMEDEGKPSETNGDVGAALVAQKRDTGPLTFVRQPRARPSTEPAFKAPNTTVSRRAVQSLRIQQRKGLIHVANRAARHPGGPTWPIEMRAETLAAFLDFSNTRELCRAIALGEAPAPHATRGSGKRLEVVWYSRAVDEFVARRNRFKQ